MDLRDLQVHATGFHSPHPQVESQLGGSPLRKFKDTWHYLVFQSRDSIWWNMFFGTRERRSTVENRKADIGNEAIFVGSGYATLCIEGDGDAAKKNNKRLPGRHRMPRWMAPIRQVVGLQELEICFTSLQLSKRTLWCLRAVFGVSPRLRLITQHPSAYITSRLLVLLWLKDFSASGLESC